MRVAFFGTSEFAVPVLSRLVETGRCVDPVVTAPAKPSGRGRKVHPSPVGVAASGLGLRVLQPEDPNDVGFVEALKAREPDVGLLVAYGWVLRQPLLDLPRLGFYNLHPSLLPHYRGAAPIQRALMDGQTRTGLTMIAMSARVDSGDILAKREIDIGTDETCGELSRRLATAGAEMVTEVLGLVEHCPPVRTRQDSAQATKAPKLKKQERTIDWNQPAGSIHNRIRALSPEPGAVTTFRGWRLVLLRSLVVTGGAPSGPGRLLDAPGLLVAAGQDAVELIEVKPEGGRAQTGRAFRNGQRPSPGEMLGNQ